MPLPCPDDMVGSLVSVPLPDGTATGIAWRRPDPLQATLLRDRAIEVPILSWPAPPKRLIRISAQLYNVPEQYVHLVEALGKVLASSA